MAQDRREPSAVHVVGNMDWDGLHRPQIYYAMVAIFSGLFLSVIDGTICNVALPTIARRVANLFLRFHLDSQCFPVGGRHDPVAMFRVG